jgi:tetratricopeptide (TPR) repeat protein/tRNA A-37 threonylcarbamoyl transferase component Bud32/TolB-like protein
MMIGQKVLHFQITEKLGEGGMGVVYKAEDTKLDRTVALKFLSTVVTDRPGEQERLANEARAAAGLQHPNIGTIYEINEYRGQTFIAMSYIDGVTLRDKVLSSTIGVDEALSTALQIAQGLEHAHDRGLIHRDIKSANIMIDGAGRAFIMDFGLARRHDQPKPDDVLSSGGTSAYMSPEQARGEEVDQRTDIWSLGVVLYEMLGGQLPFRGDYEQAVRYSIVNEEAKPLGQLRPGAPEEVLAIVDKCMRKDPADRYQSAADLSRELELVIDNRNRGRNGKRTRAGQRRAISVPIAGLVVIVAAFVAYDLFFGKPAGSDVRVPIAVIDFNNETDEPALDGLSGMLITALEQSRRLSVMTRTRMFDLLKVMGREDVERIDESLGQELCRQAGVGALVIPTIHRFGDKYTIDLKVLDTKRNEYIFTTKEEGRGQESIPGMIDEIAKEIRIDLHEETDAVARNTQNVADVTTVSLEAYKHFFEGDRYMNDLEFDKAAKELEQAIALDSTFALAHYKLAYVQWWSQHELDTAAQHIRRAMAAIDRIPEKEQYLVRALNASLEEGFDAQMPYLRAMQKLYPNDKEMLFSIGDISFHTNHYDTAQVYFERVLQLDPHFERALQHLTWTYLRTDQVDKAYDMARVWVDKTGSWEAYQYLGTAALFKGNREEAITHYQKASAITPKMAMTKRALAAAFLFAGHADKAVAELMSVVEGDYTPKERHDAYGDILRAVLPFQGRFREALQMAQAAVDTLQAMGDTPGFLEAKMGVAALHYWGWQDADGMWEGIESTYDYPDSVKSVEYWMNLAALNLVSGRIDEGMRVFEEHNKQTLAVPVYRALAASCAGDCAGAEAWLDSVVSISAGDIASVYFRTAVCYYDNGDYGSALRLLKTVASPGSYNLSNAAFIPRSHYYLGKCFDALGKPTQALEQYRVFLEAWKNADPDQPKLVEARERKAALEAAGSM